MTAELVNPITNGAIASTVSTCWLSRWRAAGRLPIPPALREVVAARHTLDCNWCDYPTDLLIDWLKEWNANQDMPHRFRVIS